ncbi:CHASE2 domain-containing protein [Pseudoalteromonas sp. MTN2-4]|uniref:CHASE2 domain-containing protein n=1 Tax=Pseudoalteromonas sp. MTN2-4 TaxID=3056555 RepID=UPI0036F444A8
MSVRANWSHYKYQWLSGLLIIILSIFIHLSFLVPGSKQGDFFKRLEGLAYDLRLQATLTMHPKRAFLPIIIVDIDEKSIKKLGRFPWSRTVVSQLHNKLLDAGVSVIAYDILFSEPEINPVDRVVEKSKNKALNNSLSMIRDNYDADKTFSTALSDSDSVIGLLFEHNKTLQVGSLPEPVFLGDTSLEDLPAPEFSGYVAGLEILQQSALGNGFINSAPDEDGFVRYAMLLAKHNGQLYPSLSLEVARLYTLSDNITVESTAFGDDFTITGLKLGIETIPTDDYGRVAIPFRGPAFSFPYVSATDVLDNKFDATLFEQSIVFIGTSAVGHADLRTTPVGVQYPGVEIHANLLEGLIFPELLPSRPDWIDGSVVLVLLIAGLIGAFVLPTLELIGIVLYFCVSIFLFLALSIFAWSQHYLDFPQVSILAMLILQVVVLGSLSFLNEHKQKIQIKSIFDQYVPPAHIQSMLDNPKSLSMSGEKKYMTVLFADIRNFTAISEQLNASELKVLLNLYFTPITQIIFEHEGTIDKYVGDMVMAFWNAPLKVNEHEQFAVLCALKMQRQVQALETEFAKQNLPKLEIGIGINSGDMNVGDMGSVYRRAYTVIGDAVNLGSRLEGITKYYGVKILVSESVYVNCKGITFRPIDMVKVKGKETSVSIYEPIGLTACLTSEEINKINLHKKAWSSYLNQNWDESLQVFTTLMNNHPKEKLYSIFCERIKNLSTIELNKDWDGSYKHVTK